MIFQTKLVGKGLVMTTIKKGGAQQASLNDLGIEGDAGYWILDAGYWMLESECGKYPETSIQYRYYSIENQTA